MSRNAFAAALSKLKAHRDDNPVDLRQAFADDAGRFSKFSLVLDDLLLDWSKCAVADETMQLLAGLAEAAGVEKRRAAMFAGDKINGTERRAVLHTALRAPRNAVIDVDGENVVPGVHAVLDAMGAFADAVRSGAATGATGKKITDIVNIGIGGSDLGPVMATLALAPYHDGPRAHFVSNIDGAHIHDVLKDLSAETTLFIVASKTFTTIETMTNAETARRWVEAALGGGAVGKHFCAVSTALDLVARFGIDKDRVFGFWDWVGGRYSLWSAIGLPIMIAVGPENFHAFLEGAHAMDRHFATAPALRNMPIIMGLIGFWHRVVCACPARAVIPYDQRLARLPAYLQQLDMESNGKSVTLDGGPVATPTGPLVWGEPGTNGQHAFFQLIHQGTEIVPCEFLLAAQGHEPALAHQHRLLAANCLAQAEALMRGRPLNEARAMMKAKGLAGKELDRQARHRVFPGNRPSTMLLYPRLTPAVLGAILALYEHRVFVEGVILGINSFDQWGVELGKELAQQLVPMVEGSSPAEGRDGSTLALIATLRRLGV